MPWNSIADGQFGIIAVNIRAVTDLMLRFLPGMVERKAGRILNVASVAGFAPGPRMAVYFASKAYLVSLSQALMRESEGDRRDGDLPVPRSAAHAVPGARRRAAGAARSSCCESCPSTRSPAPGGRR